MKKLIIKQVCKATAAFGHAGYYAAGECMNHVVSYWLETSQGRKAIEAAALKAAAHLGKMPTIQVLNRKLAGKTIKVGADITKEIAKLL